MRLVPALSWKLETEAGEAVDARLVPLLEAIATTKSLSAAVVDRRMSYRAAWGLLRDYRRKLGVPLVRLERGRGAQLAPAGAQLLRAQRGAGQRLARLLPRFEVDLGAGVARAPGTPGAGLRVAASNDLVLAALRDALAGAAGLKLELSFMGSLYALQQFAEGRVAAAGFHIPIGARGTRAMTPFREWLNPRRDRLIRFVDREQGLILPRSNPARVHSFDDIARKRLRFVNRQPGSGTRLLIDRIAAGEGVRPESLIGYSKEEFTHPAVAATVASGAADAGFGLRAAAAERGLSFVPLARERYYLAFRASDLDTVRIAALLQLLRGHAFARLARGYPGYDPARSGTVAGVDTLGTA
jgi:molybdate transport repressor ModE-like protein